jgi:hypothetical protein
MTTKLECEGALSDLVLQGARASIPPNPEQLLSIPAVGIRNQPLLPLLIGLIDATQVTAKAIGDNAWDDCQPLDQQLAAELAKQCRAIAADLENATACPDSSAWAERQETA